MPNWTLRAGYDPRFGSLALKLVDGSQQVDFHVSLGKLLRDLKIKPYELKAILEDKYQWTEGLGDIESARRKAIKKTKLKDKVVLDIGGYDGSMAALALSQGAAKAICLDNQQYHHYGWEEKRFEGVEYITGDFVDWKEPVDVTIFYNVLYHLKNPWQALDHLRDITKKTMLLCTLFRYHEGAWMYVYEPRECNLADETVYFGLSLEALERLLTATGWAFKQEALALDRVVYSCKPKADWKRSHQDT